MLASSTDRLCRYASYRGLVMNSSEGAWLAEVLGNKRVLLQASHGVMVCRETVWQVHTCRALQPHRWVVL